jgi:HNH endonuclease
MVAKIKKLPSQSRIRQLLDYDPITGIFRWRVNRGSRYYAGAKAGSINSNGYIVIRIDGVLYSSHRIAMVYLTGDCPPEVDHINLVRSDNRFENLRQATRAQNRMNSPTHKNNRVGIKGVHFRSRNGYRRPYEANIRIDGRLKNLGRFATADEAQAAYVAAAKECFGEFFRAG